MSTEETKPIEAEIDEEESHMSEHDKALAEKFHETYDEEYEFTW